MTSGIIEQGIFPFYFSFVHGAPGELLLGALGERF
jgi:hypothetical protein